MAEVMQSNSLENIEELHLMAQYPRGRKLLTKEFALHLIKTFSHLKHFGIIRLWNMASSERREFRTYVKANNLDLVIDSDTEARPSENNGFFRNIFVPNKCEAACSWLPVRKVHTFSFFEEVADMFAEPALLWPGGFEASDDESNDEGGESDEEFDLENDQEHVQVGFDPLRNIQ